MQAIHPVKSGRPLKKSNLYCLYIQPSGVHTMATAKPKTVKKTPVKKAATKKVIN